MITALKEIKVKRAGTCKLSLISAIRGNTWSDDEQATKTGIQKMRWGKDHLSYRPELWQVAVFPLHKNQKELF